MKNIKILDREQLPKSYEKNEVDIFRAKTVFQILNDPENSWSVQKFFTDSSQEQNEAATKNQRKED